MTLPTNSALPRVFACPASHVLPHAEIDEPSEFRDRGVAVHAYLENASAVDVDPSPALLEVPAEHRDFCEAIDLSRLPLDLTPEVALAYDIRTGEARILPRKHHRDYSAATEWEICGTVDVLGKRGRTAYVADYKTGWANLGPIARNEQLLMGALAACRALDCDDAEIAIIEIRGERPFHRSAHVDAFDLLAFEDRVEVLMRTADPEPHPGPHCKYCPAFAACPAQAELALAVDDGSMALEVEQSWAGGLTPQSAVYAYRQMRQMAILSKRAGDIVRAYAREHPIDLGGGRVYGPVERAGTERLDGDATWGVVRELHGRDVADAACGRTATKVGIDRALREHKAELGGSQKDAKAAILDAVRAAGGVTRKPSSRVEEYDA